MSIRFLTYPNKINEDLRQKENKSLEASKIMHHISANKQNPILEPSMLLKVHMSMFNDKAIFVHYNKEKGLFGSVCVLKGSDANNA